MNRKALVSLVLAGAMAVSASSVFGAPSKTNHSSLVKPASSGGSSTSVAAQVSSSTSEASSSDAVSLSIDAKGIGTTASNTVTGQNGRISLVVSGTASTGKAITYNESTGSAVYGKVSYDVSSGKTAAAGASKASAKKFDTIEKSGTLDGVIPGASGTKTISEGISLSQTDSATGTATNKVSVATFVVDNLTEADSNVVVGFYNPKTGNFSKLKVLGVDYASKTVTVRVLGSGTVWVATK